MGSSEAIRAVISRYRQLSQAHEIAATIDVLIKLGDEWAGGLEHRTDRALSKLRDVLEGLTPLTAAPRVSSVELWIGDPAQYEGQLTAWVADVTE